MTIQVVGASVPSTFFSAQTISGHQVVFSFHRCIAIVAPDGYIYKRMEYCNGAISNKVDVELGNLLKANSDKAYLCVNCSEREWEEVERNLSDQIGVNDSMMARLEKGNGERIGR